MGILWWIYEKAWEIMEHPLDKHFDPTRERREGVKKVEWLDLIKEALIIGILELFIEILESPKKIYVSIRDYRIKP